MVKNVRINRILQDHERRISALESILTKKPTKPIKNKKTLADYILELRDKKFFLQPKTAAEVHKKLQRSYPCESDRVAMALLRLFKKKQLRKASKRILKKKYTAYVG